MITRAFYCLGFVEGISIYCFKNMKILNILRSISAYKMCKEDNSHLECLYTVREFTLLSSKLDEIYVVFEEVSNVLNENRNYIWLQQFPYRSRQGERSTQRTRKYPQG